MIKGYLLCGQFNNFINKLTAEIRGAPGFWNVAYDNIFLGK
jgi:hypothetical protein